MNFIVKVLTFVVACVLFPYAILFTGLVLLAPVIVPVFLWLWYEHYCDKKHQEMAIATNAIAPGSYCDECFSRLAGNTAEHPHTYACSHSKELHIPKTKRSSL